MNNFFKTILPVGLCILAWNSSIAQTSGVEYVYDAAGNRVQRNVIIIGGGNRMMNDTLKILKNDFIVTIFPNVTNGKLTVSVDEKFLELKAKKVSIFDINGLLLESREIRSRKEELDLSTYSNGSYIVKISADSGYGADWKVIKL